jgi:hypothetical protein
MSETIEYLNHRIAALERELEKKDTVIKWYVNYEKFADDGDATDYADNQEY